MGKTGAVEQELTNDIVFGAFVAVGGFLFFIAGLNRQHLWLDEIFSATYAAQSLFDVVVSTLRFDAHPPLYYLQLALWSMLGTSDFFLLLSSVVWMVAAACSLPWLRIAGVSRETLWGGALLFLALPMTLRYAHELRMYAMVTALTVWLAIAIGRAVADGWSRRSLIAVGLIELCIFYSYVGAVVVVASTAVYGFLLMWPKVTRQQFIRWLGVHLGVGAVALPAVLNSMLRSTTEPPMPGAAEVATTIGHLTLGPIAESGVGTFVAVAMFASVLTFGFLDARTRPLAMAMVALPYLMIFVISHMFRSVWLDRSLLFTTPFFCVIAATAATVLIRRIQGLVSATGTAVPALCFTALVLVLVGSSAMGGQFFFKPTNYRAAAEAVASELQPGDIIYVPENASFWGIARYLVGPRWGSPLAIQDPVAPDSSDKWAAILRKLGPEWRRRLHLEPISRSIVAKGVPLVVGWSPPDELDAAKRVWLITHSTNKPIDVPPLSGFTESRASDYAALTVHLMVRSVR